MSHFKDLTGLVFGRLTVLSYAGINKNKHTMWKVKCICGNISTKHGYRLIQKNVVSCGCFKIDEFLKRNTKHSMSNTPEWLSWSRMRYRCYDKTCKDYPNYGGRGITVCDRWLGKNGFSNFLKDMGLRPSPKHSLDRFPNNKDGNYEPTNCKWSSRKQQNRNKRNNVWLTYNGIKMILTEWSVYFKINHNSLRYYIKKYGWEKSYLHYMSKLNNTD